LLDQVVEDRRITEDESEKLFDLAVDLGLSRDQLAAAHSAYMESLVSTSFEDGSLSDFELRDLNAVCRLLLVSPDALQLMIRAGRTQTRKPENKVSASTAPDDVRGRSVCFTGELTGCLYGQPIDRESAKGIAIKHGMIVKSGVSRKLDFLVAADPDSNSDKAKKAREYGTRIISEAQFWRMVGVQVE
jgi:DNA polymerase-3 subunit epsilon